MTIAFVCIAIGGLLPYLATLVAKVGGRRFDNADPRTWLAAQDGYRKRADAAQHNGFEAFPLFASAVIVAHLARGPDAVVDGLAVAFVVFRALYLAAYLANQASLRSVVWFGGFFASVAIFFAAAR